MMIRLRRWRVARVNIQRKGGYDSPRTTYWTLWGAQAAALQLNTLNEKFNQARGVLSGLQGSNGEYHWMPVRHRTLCGVQAHNIVMESGSYDRHPAGGGSQYRKTRASKRRFDRPAPATFNLCENAGECAGPWRMDGHCVHCGGPSRALRENMEEYREERTNEDQERPVEATPETLGDSEDVLDRI